LFTQLDHVLVLKMSIAPVCHHCHKVVWVPDCDHLTAIRVAGCERVLYQTWWSHYVAKCAHTGISEAVVWAGCCDY